MSTEAEVIEEVEGEASTKEEAIWDRQANNILLKVSSISSNSSKVNIKCNNNLWARDLHSPNNSNFPLASLNSNNIHD